MSFNSSIFFFCLFFILVTGLWVRIGYQGHSLSLYLDESIAFIIVNSICLRKLDTFGLDAYVYNFNNFFIYFLLMSMKCPSLSLLISYGLRSLWSYTGVPISTCIFIFLEYFSVSLYPKIISKFDGKMCFLKAAKGLILF